MVCILPEENPARATKILSSLSRKYTLFLSLDFLPHPAGLMVQTVNNQLIINTTIGYNRGIKFV